MTRAQELAKLRKLTMRQLVERQKLNLDPRSRRLYKEEEMSRLSRGDEAHRPAYTGPYVPFPRRKTPGSSFRRLARAAPSPKGAKREMNRALGVPSRTRKRSTVL